jgi:hypothetical protein
VKKDLSLSVRHILLILLLVAIFPAVELISTYTAKPVQDDHTALAEDSLIPEKYTAQSSETTSEANEHTLPIEEEKKLYIEIINSCGPYWTGICAGIYSTPIAGTSTPVTYVRNGTTLYVDEKVTDADGNEWYKIIFDEWLRYPQRVTTDWYIQSVYGQEVSDVGLKEMSFNEAMKKPSTSKRILIDKSEQKLYAYENDVLFMETTVSTGTVINPTPIGEFAIFRKTPSRYMQGPLPSIPDDIYDLPGVPWSLYFTTDGAAIHGTYWHNNFGNRLSHGCVNLPIPQARQLYGWADLTTKVIVQE